MRRLSNNSEINNATIINTCAVTAEAVRKAKQSIRKIRRESPDRKIVVTGCAAQIEPKEFSEMEEVNLVLGNSEKVSQEIWNNLHTNEALSASDTRTILVSDIMSAKETASHLIDGFGTRTRAYVQIQNGCDHRCTFCIIPYGRGNSRSIPAGVIIEQIKKLVDKGFKEVVLTGVDITSWGNDLPFNKKLGSLVKKILKLVPDLPRLRISSIDSVEVDQDLMDCIQFEKRLMPHLHLSLQSGDNLILKRMKRRHNRDDAITFCQTLKESKRKIIFGADIIVGFPTETEFMFRNSVNLIKECDLTWLHIFPYSVRKNTPAALMPQVDKVTIKDRAKRLNAIKNNQIIKYLQKQVGTNQQVLMEKPHLGRTESFAEVITSAAYSVGSVIDTKIKSHNGTQFMT